MSLVRLRSSPVKPPILTVVGARPQFIKAKPIGSALQAAGYRELLVHTGQHYDDAMSEAIFRDLDLREADINLGVGSGRHGAQTGAMLAGIEEVIVEHEPAAVITYGDTNSTIAGALAAAKLHVPTAHVEAGLRSHNRVMPEELNRIATDHLSDLLFAPTELAMKNLASEGLAERSRLVGDVMVDMLLSVDLDSVERPGWADGRYVVATIHRAENTDDANRLAAILSALAAFPLPVHLLAHPRLVHTADRLGLGAQLDTGALQSHDPVPYTTLLAIAAQATAVVTDSGGLQKEAFVLGTPCTTVRTETEWPETFAGGMNMLAPESLGDLASVALRSVAKVDTDPYGTGDAAGLVVEALGELL